MPGRHGLLLVSAKGSIFALNGTERFLHTPPLPPPLLVNGEATEDLAHPVCSRLH